MRLFVLLFFSLLLSFTESSSVWAAACCARSPAAPFLILGDDQSQVNFGLSSASQVSQADADGIVHARPENISDRIWNYRIDTAMLLSDLAQVGLSVPFVHRFVSGPGFSDRNFALGDVRLSFGYEAFPLWSYSPWKPQGFLFSVVNLPTGRASYQSELPSLADVSGNGFFALSVGGLFLKRWSSWDAFVLTEVHYSFSRTFENLGFSYAVDPGWGASLGGGLGWSPSGGRLRIGMRFQPRWDQQERIVSVNRGLSGQGGARWVTDTGIDLSYLIADSNTIMMSYTDQTWLGPTQSAPLNRSVVMSYQHRWPR